MKRHFHNRINQYLDELNAEERDMKLHNNGDNDDYDDWDDDDTEWDDDAEENRIRERHRKNTTDIQQDIAYELSELDKELREAYQDGVKDGHAEALRMLHIKDVYMIPLYTAFGMLLGLLLRTILVSMK